MMHIAPQRAVDTRHSAFEDGRDPTASSTDGAHTADLPVLYRDAHLAIVDKPAGLMVHDSALARGETDFAADRLREQFGCPIFLVHRLDRATSGCLLLAFDRDTASALGRMVMDSGVGTAASDPAASARVFEKEYLAICRGWPEPRFVVDHPLDGGPGKPIKKPAITEFECLATAELAIASQGFATSRYALLRARPRTGRFRQIRRHLKHMSHHLIGDTSHGDGRHNRSFRMLGIHRMLLHAERLAFVHPVTGVRICAIAPPDAQFQRALHLFDAAAASVA
jgi:tRNA pseudouridine65 synthase